MKSKRTLIYKEILRILFGKIEEGKPGEIETYKFIIGFISEMRKWGEEEEQESFCKEIVENYETPEILGECICKYGNLLEKVLEVSSCEEKRDKAIEEIRRELEIE